jgi:hypothetical protein
MFAEGDKVFYQGRGMLRKDLPYYVERVVNEFIFIAERRYQSSSFVRKEQEEPAVAVPLLQELTDKVTKQGVGVCSYALEFEGGHRRFQVEDVCHARLAYGGRYCPAEEHGKKLLAVALNVSGHVAQYKGEVAERYKRHVQYILTESPWKDAFIQKPLEEVYTSGVYLDLTKEFWYCVAAAVALRTGSEFDNCLPIFQRLLDLNYSPNVSYVVSQLSHGLNAFNLFPGGHHVLNNATMTMEAYVSFFNTGKFSRCSGMSYQEASGREYRIDPLIQEKIEKTEVSLFNYVMTKLKHVVTKEQRGWGVAYDSIKFDNPDNLIRVANLFAKEIK